VKSAQSETPQYVVLEGNIGAGKSTFLNIIQEYLTVPVIYEPVDQWQSVGTGKDNLLERFYTDTTRWAYTFQSYAFVTRVRAQEEQMKQNPYPISVLERSVFSDRYCFAKNAFENGHMNALEWKLYQEWFAWLVEQYVTQPAGFIYLRTNPEICYQRLIKRDRQEEATVSLDYLKQLHDRHDTWLQKKEGILPTLQEVPVLILDCAQEFESDSAYQDELIQQVNTFMQELTPSFSNSYLSKPQQTISL